MAGYQADYERAARDLKHAGQFSDLTEGQAAALTHALVDDRLEQLRAVMQAQMEEAEEAAPTQARKEATPSTSPSTGDTKSPPPRKGASTGPTEPAPKAAEPRPTDPFAWRTRARCADEAWAKLGTTVEDFRARQIEAAEALKAGGITQALYDSLSLRAEIGMLCERRCADLTVRSRIAVFEGIARKCEAGRGESPAGYGITSGEVFMKAVEGSRRRASCQGLLSSLLDQAQAALLPTLGFDALRKLCEELSLSIPFFQSEETSDEARNLIATVLLSVLMLDMARRGGLPGEVVSTAPRETKSGLPRDLRFARWITATSRAFSGLVIGKLLQSSSKRLYGLAQYGSGLLCGGISSWLGFGVSGGYDVPAWVNAVDEAQPWELEQIDRALQRGSWGAATRDWVGGLTATAAQNGPGGWDEAAKSLGRDMAVMGLPYHVMDRLVGTERTGPAHILGRTAMGIGAMVLEFMQPRGAQRDEAARTRGDRAIDRTVTLDWVVQDGWVVGGKLGYERKPNPQAWREVRRDKRGPRGEPAYGPGMGPKSPPPDSSAPPGADTASSSADAPSEASRSRRSHGAPRTKKKHDRHTIGSIPTTQPPASARASAPVQAPHQFKKSGTSFRNLPQLQQFLVAKGCGLRTNGSHYTFTYPGVATPLGVTPKGIAQSIPGYAKDIDAFLQDLWNAGVR